MKSALIQNVVAVNLLLTLAACGPKLESVGSSNSGTNGTTKDGRRETVTIGISVEERTNTLALAAATGYSMALEGCASGLAYPSLTQANPNVDVYKYDQNCLIKLTAFSINGINYAPSGDDPFSSWIAGDIATFEEVGNAANKLRVVVTSQLASPISGTESVDYSFSQIIAGADGSLAQSVVGANHALSVSGQDATPLTVAALNFTGMTAAGAGQFVFTLDCAENVTGTAPAHSCAGTPLANLKYKLVKDTFGGVLTLSQASAIFDGSELSIADAEVLSVGQSGSAHGGFVTKSGASALTGPDVMHSNPNMILVVQVAGISYRYFNIDVATLTYP